MKTIPFKGCNVEVAADQPEYNSMPGMVYGDPSGTKLFCWQLTCKERIKILFTGRLWQYMLCFDQYQQPQRMTVDEPKAVTLIRDLGLYTKDWSSGIYDDMYPVVSSVDDCSSCGSFHMDLIFTPSLMALDNGYTHEGSCPETHEPLFFRYGKD